MRVGDVEVAVFQRPLRAKMTHDEFLEAYSRMADAVENDYWTGIVGSRPRAGGDSGELDRAARMRAQVDAVRSDPIATRRLAEECDVILSEDRSPEACTLHAVDAVAAAIAVVTRRPLRTLCGAPMPAQPAPKGSAVCPRCAQNRPL